MIFEKKLWGYFVGWGGYSRKEPFWLFRSLFRWNKIILEPVKFSSHNHSKHQQKWPLKILSSRILTLEFLLFWVRHILDITKLKKICKKNFWWEYLIWAFSRGYRLLGYPAKIEKITPWRQFTFLKRLGNSLRKMSALSGLLSITGGIIILCRRKDILSLIFIHVR